MQNNLDAVLEVMKFIYDHIIYAELNTKSDYCQVCGWDGEIEIVEQDGKLIWKCPQCGNTDQDKMNVARRTCGYIGTQFWNQGRPRAASVKTTQKRRADARLFHSVHDLSAGFWYDPAIGGCYALRRAEKM